MNVRLIAAACASILVGFGAHSLAQSNADRATGTVTQPDKRDSFTHGESKRCESMTGAEKAQCDKEEGTKGGDDTQASGSSAGSSFTHGESKRCEGMTGADKEQCDKEEATKTQGAAAREASK